MPTPYATGCTSLGMQTSRFPIHLSVLGKRIHQTIREMICELALAHDERDLTEAAYSRSDLLEKRSLPI